MTCYFFHIVQALMLMSVFHHSKLCKLSSVLVVYSSVPNNRHMGPHGYMITY